MELFTKTEDYLCNDDLVEYFEEIKNKPENPANLITFGNKINEEDSVNHMPYSVGLYFDKFSDGDNLPEEFSKDVELCKKMIIKVETECQQKKL
ncbi:MAG: hypothetical protein GQ570_04195 [Helicobacteraceae bacterium]|nr:hypothetical protein [Helicobacteraceae bacterium]